MASSKKKTKRKTTPKNKKANASENNFIKNEIKLLVFFALAVIFELSVLGFCGRVGNFISYVLFGLFGMLAYLFPILLFVGIAFLISNLNNNKAIIKLITCLVLFILLCTLVQMITETYDQNTALSDYFTYSAASHQGGGFFGSALMILLCSLVEVVGAYIIIAILMIICIVIITEKSFINGVKHGSTKVYNSAKDDMARLKEQRELNREREQLKRAENKARGVQVVKLKEPGPFQDEVHEITQEEFRDKVFRGHVEVPEPVQQSQNAQQSFDTPEQFLEKEYSKPVSLNKRAEKKSTGGLPEQSVQPEHQEPPERQVQLEYQAASQLQELPEQPPMPEPELERSGLEQQRDSEYEYPSLSLLAKAVHKAGSGNTEILNETAMKLQQTLQNFGVKVTVTNYSQGPSVTRYELQPEMGTKVSKITSLVDDIKLNLAVADIRIEAPIPGKAAVGIEVPNSGKETVYLRELLESKELMNHPSKIAFAAGKDISGNVVVADIAKMPHMLVAGTTGSGKSVFINSIIMTILFRAKPSEVKLIIVDPKVVEFGVYNGIPHLLNPVVTDPKMASSVLNWAVAEMLRRYKILAENNVRDFKSYNDKIEHMDIGIGEERPEKIPQILIVIDELADLMMVAAKAVEDSICRLAQLARAAGIHLIIATQRPSVDVVTGLIKANVPSRVALLVSSGTDSRTIIDMNGAEKLLGNGDMLFYPSGYVKPVRVQGAYISDTEVSKSVAFLKEQRTETEYDPGISEHITAEVQENTENSKSSNNGRDEYFEEAGRFVIEREKASASMLQRKFNVGFNRAARIIDQLHDYGVAGPEEGSKPRRVLMSLEEFEQICLELNS